MGRSSRAAIETKMLKVRKGQGEAVKVKVL